MSGTLPTTGPPHASQAGDVLGAMQGTPNGLNHAEAAARLNRC